MIIQNGLFVDGSVLGSNPSKLGGGFAWCLVENDAIIKQGSGIVTPEQFGFKSLTNNFTELLAAIMALREMTPDFVGPLYTDSAVTYFRLTRHDPSFKGITNDIIQEVMKLRRRESRMLKCRMVNGHPTKEELAAGIGRRGQPVSRWNVWCDSECNRLSDIFLTNLRNTPKN